MTMSTNWDTAAQNALADEAIQLHPGLAAAQLRGDTADCTRLYRSYLERARELRVSDLDAWKIFGVSAMFWIAPWFDERAGGDPDEYPQIAMELVGQVLERADGG